MTVEAAVDLGDSMEAEADEEVNFSSSRRINHLVSIQVSMEVVEVEEVVDLTVVEVADVVEAEGATLTWVRWGVCSHC